MPSVTAVIPAYRDLHLLSRTIPLLLASEGVTLHVVIVNNDPAQDVAGLVREHGWNRVQVREAGRNTGYTGAANIGIRETRSEFVLIGNDDLFLTPDYLARLLAVLAERREVGCIGGKLLRYDLRTDCRTATIDSAGVFMRRGRGAFDRGEGLPDCGQYETAGEVFGISGAAMLLRRTTLDDIACAGEYFDEDMFMYKEDIDLSWRLHLRGWECWYEPAAVAYHGRTSSSLGGRSYAGGARAYLGALRSRPAHAREYSLKNQWLMLLKNESRATLLPDLPAVLAREALSLGANALTSPGLTARSVAAFLRALPAALRKRRSVQAHAIGTDLKRWLEER